MSEKNAKVGLSADLFDTNGHPMFGDAVLSLFSDAGVDWGVLPVTEGQLPATAFSDYEALMIGGSKVSEKELASESGKLRIIARNGVGYDAVDTKALTARHSSNQHANSGEKRRGDNGAHSRAISNDNSTSIRR